MTPEDYRTAIDFIADHLFPKLKVGQEHHVTIEYLGGEVLLIPEAELRENVAYARNRLGSLVKTLRDGAQSNLIGTPRRILSLHDIFDGNLSTSWDPHTGQRTVSGKAQLYNRMLETSLNALSRERQHATGRVMVVDQKTAPYVIDDVTNACSEGHDLLLRPVFLGGSDDIDPLQPGDLAELMVSAYRAWRENPTVRVQPFYSLLHRRLNRGAPGHLSQQNQGCPFQSDCAFKSISLDPDGGLYICQEMADAGHFPLGNALTGDFDDTTWRRLARRSFHLDAECQKCPWKSECGGGCMNEAIEVHGDPFAKTELCPVWKSLFAEIEKDIDSGRATDIQRTVK